MSDKISKKTRRQFLFQTGIATAGLSVGTHNVFSTIPKTFQTGNNFAAFKKPSIMIGFIWTIKDIGGAAIGTGLLNQLYKYFPGYKMSTFGGETELQKYTREKFPECDTYDVKVLSDSFQEALEKVKNDFGGTLPKIKMEHLDYAFNTFPEYYIAALKKNNPEFLKAVSSTGLLIYTSGMMINYGELTLAGMGFWGRTMAYSMPLLVARKLGVKYGIYAQSFTAFEDPPAVAFAKDLLEGAAFVSCRDGDSVNYIKSLGINPPGIKFVPDSTVSFGLRDDKWGASFMKKKKLKPKEFLVIIPRTWPRPSIITQFIGEERSKRHVNRLLTITENWVKKTGMKVLIAAEVKVQLPNNKPAVYDLLPDDIKPHCELLEEFWLPEQATSIYHNARIIVHMDFHSFYLAIPEGTPCVAPMTRESGRKIWSYRDFKLGEYMFDIDTTATSTIENAIYYIHNNYDQESERIKNIVIPHLRAIENTQMNEIVSILQKTHDKG